MLDTLLFGERKPRANWLVETFTGVLPRNGGCWGRCSVDVYAW